MTNLKTLTTSQLVARLHSIESALHWARTNRRDRPELALDWIRTRNELNSRPTAEVLAV